MKTNKDIEGKRLGSSAKGTEEGEARHTPTPWFQDGPTVHVSDGHRMDAGCSVDAEFIVTAVNEYEQNKKDIEALREIANDQTEKLKKALLYIVEADKNKEALIESVRNVLNGLYALRDVAIETGHEAIVEQRLIDIGKNTIKQAEGTL